MRLYAVKETSTRNSIKQFGKSMRQKHEATRSKITSTGMRFLQRVEGKIRMDKIKIVTWREKLKIVTMKNLTEENHLSRYEHEHVGARKEKQAKKKEEEEPLRKDKLNRKSFSFSC